MLDEGSGVGARSGPFDFTFGLKGLVQGLPPLLAGGQAGGRAGRGGDEAAVVRAEAAEARADLAEKYLVGLGTPREVVEVLQRKCAAAQVDPARAVCLDGCVNVCMYVCMYVYACMYMYVCICICACVCVYACN